MVVRAACALALALLVQTSAAQDVKLPPVDEGATDAVWPRFKARLLDALERRDRQFVLGILDRNIRNTSGTSGIAEFRKLWEPDAAESPLWSQLSAVLFLGSVYVKRDAKTQELCAPYIYYRWPADAPESLNGAVIVKETLLKSNPSAAAATVATLSYDLVAVSSWEVADESKESPQKWVKAKAGSNEGFAPEEHVRSPLEYRACFVKAGERWRMTALEVGE